MADNISVNITADATKLRAQLALAQEDLKHYSAEVRKAAQEVRTAGNQATAEQIVALEKASAAMNTAKGSVTNYSTQLKTAKPALEELTKATHNHGAATEAMVLVHEAMSGRFSKMGGSLMILTSRMAGNSGAMMALAGAFGVGAMAAMHLIEWLHKLHDAKLLAEAGGIGSGVSNADLDAQVKKLAKIGDTGVEVAGKVVHAFASIPGTSKPVIDELTSGVSQLALRMGDDVPQAAGRIVEAWNLNARAGAELLEKTRALPETIKAFTKAAEDNDAIKARSILLYELARNTREVNTQTSLGAQGNAFKALVGQQQDLAKRQPGLQGTGPASGEVDPSKKQIAAIERTKAALGALTDQMKTPPPVSWSQQMTEQLHLVTREAGMAARTQGKDWRATHEGEAKATVTFWQGVVGQTKEGTKNRIEAEDKLVQAEEARDMIMQRLAERSAKHTLQEHLAGLAAEVAANHDNLGMVQDLENQKLAIIRAAEGEHSKLYKDELKIQTQVVRSAVMEQVRLVEEAAREDVQAVRAAATQMQAERKKSHAEILQGVVDQTALIGEQELRQLDNLIATLAKGTLAEREAMHAREKLARELADRQIQEQSRATEEVIKANEAQMRVYKQAFDGIASAGRSTITGLITGTETWRKAQQKVATAVLESAVNMGMHMVGRWIAMEMTKNEVSATATAVRSAIARGDSGFDALITSKIAAWLGMETTKTTATVTGLTVREAAEISAAGATKAINMTTTASDIGGKAARAAAGAYAAIVEIPIVGPVLAPIAAGVAFAAVSAFGMLPSFDVGAWSLPSDMVAQVHAGEMIIPADVAAGIRGGASPFPSAPGAAGGGGAVHLHVHANDASSVAALFRSNGAELARIVSAQMKNNPSLRLAY